MTVSTNGSTTANHPEQTTTIALPRARSFVNYLDDFGAWADENHTREKSGLAKGPAISLFPRLTEAIGGYIEPGAHYLHAPPGSGKSALANQIAATCGCPALIVTTELAMRELFLRQIARVMSRPLTQLKSGILTGSELRLLAEKTAEAMPHVCVLDATTRAVSMQDIQREIRELKDNAGHLLFVLDSLNSLIRRNASGQNEYERVTQASADLEALTLAENVAAVLIAERPRAAQKEKGNLHGAKGSGSIEYTGAGVWSLDDDEDGKRNSDDSINVTLTLAKNRNGHRGEEIQFKFFPTLMKFIEQ
jgi:replicative DNA helicase